MSDLDKDDQALINELTLYSQLSSSDIQYIKNALIIQKKTFIFLDLPEVQAIQEPIKVGGSA